MQTAVNFLSANDMVFLFDDKFLQLEKVIMKKILVFRRM